MEGNSEDNRHIYHNSTIALHNVMLQLYWHIIERCDKDINWRAIQI